MSGVEIDRIRTRLAERPRPADLAVRRQRVDILCADYPLPPDVTVEAVAAQEVPAEWTRKVAFCSAPNPSSARNLLLDRHEP